MSIDNKIKFVYHNKCKEQMNFGGIMKIIKVFNNNVVNSLDDNNMEVIVLGSGIGFNRKPGDMVDETKVEKIFRLPGDITDERKTYFQNLVESIPYEYIKYSDEIIGMAAKSLKKKLNRNIYITLTDHIYYAVERYRQNIEVSNAMLHEIRSFYKPEYLLGLRAVELINEAEKVSLGDDEAAFIALHIVNAEFDVTMNQAMNMPKMIGDIQSIVRMSLRRTVREDGIAYERFIVHLKYMLRRTFRNERYPEGLEDVFELLKDSYPEAFAIAKKIRKYILEKTGNTIPDREIGYLILHLVEVSRECDG